MSIINTPRLARLWQDAQVHPEWATTRLWEYLFNHVVFNDEKFIVSTQQPPTHQPGELRRVDLVVERMDSRATTVGTLLFLEAKRASASPSDIAEVEYQAFTAACAYHIETGLKHLWAMTCVGSAAWLWIFGYKSYFLIPFVPSEGGLGVPDRSQYLEMSTNGRQILEGLEYVKRHPMPPNELLGNTPSPRPADAPLPAPWHGNEVHILDALRQQEDVVPLPTDPAAMDMDYGAGPSSLAASQNLHGFGHGSGNQKLAWSATGEPQSTTHSYFEEGVQQDDGPSGSRQGGEDRKEVDRKEVEVRVTRISHTMRKDEFCFDRNGRNQSSTEDDWVKERREGRAVWVYRHGRKTVYWTRKLG